MILRSTTKDTLDLLVSLIPHIEKIVKHEKILALFTQQFFMDENDDKFKEKGYEFVIDKTLELLPVLLDDLREDILMILAKVNDTCIVEIEEQHPLVTIRQVKELLTDKELVGFVQELV